jgi:hypothetical protein
MHENLQKGKVTWDNTERAIMSKRGIGIKPKAVRPWKQEVMRERRKLAEERQGAYNKLTIEQKLKKLDAGNFVAKKQRAKLLAQLQSRKP